MSMSFTCTWAKPNDAAALPKQLATKLQREGYISCETLADRCLTLLATENSPWVFLLDSHTVDCPPDGPQLRKTTRKLAKALACDVLAAEVITSDALGMVLCTDASEDVLMRNAEGYGNLGFGARTGRGKAEIWQTAFCLADEQTQQLRLLWQRDDVFAEHKLADLLALLGIDPKTLDYLDAEQAPPDYSITQLHFQAKQKPFELIDHGDTVVDFNSWTNEIVLGGNTVHTYFNTGGSSTGAAFVLVSDFFANFQGTFSPVTLEKSKDRCIRHWLNYNCEVHTAQFEKTATPDGRIAMIAHFPEFVFPQGIQINRDAVQNWKAADDARSARSMIVRYAINSQSNVPPNTIVEVALIPLTENPQAKSCKAQLQTQQQYADVMRERHARMGCTEAVECIQELD
ncbi:MAG: hypothetical protein FWD06_08890 [Oscillospiraceae bacterium]|nr:hypothetical protein [Oscillospiraceae bacterium]